LEPERDAIGAVPEPAHLTADLMFHGHVVDPEDLGATRKLRDHGHRQCQAMHD
jgi:hypothetical protein